MINIRLEKDYRDHKKGDIISVSNNVAFGLEDSGIGKRVQTEDFTKKTQFGQTKAFAQAPSQPKKKNESVAEEVAEEAESEDEATEEEL